MLTVCTYQDARLFLQDVETFLLKKEAINNLITSSCLSLARNPRQIDDLPEFYSVVQSSEIFAVAICVQGRLIISTSRDLSAVTTLSLHLLQNEATFTIVHAPTPEAKVFIEVWNKSATPKLMIGMEQRLLQLTRALAVPEVLGRMQAAQNSDFARLSDWSLQFVLETGLSESPGETREVTRKCIESGRLFVWSMNGEPKAMAGYSGLTPQSVRLNMVYSPLANRRQGFATNLVAQLSSYLLNKGWLSCVLFADKQNLVSNRLYEKIGYQPISDFLELNLLGSQLMQTSH